MRKFFALPIALILFASCGAPETEMDYDQVFDILSAEDGTVAGISIGDNWTDAQTKLTALIGDAVEFVEPDSQYPTAKIDYGMEGRNFYIELTLQGGIISMISINAGDIRANEAKVDDLHTKLVDHFTKKYPEGYVRSNNNDPDYDDYGTWIVSEEVKLSIIEPHMVGTAPGAVKAHSFTLEVLKH